MTVGQLIKWLEQWPRDADVSPTAHCVFLPLEGGGFRIEFNYKPTPEGFKLEEPGQ